MQAVIYYAHKRISHYYTVHTLGLEGRRNVGSYVSLVLLVVLDLHQPVHDVKKPRKVGSVEKERKDSYELHF